MGTLTSALTQIGSTISTINTITSGVQQLTGQNDRMQKSSQRLAMQNLRERQQLSEQQANANAQLSRAELAERSKQEDENRRKALKRAMARQNVNRGASGISSNGSNEAILLGLYNDADDDRQNANALDQIRFNTIDNDLYNLQQNNILQRTQLAQKQKLDRAISRA